MCPVLQERESTALIGHVMVMVNWLHCFHLSIFLLHWVSWLVSCERKMMFCVSAYWLSDSVQLSATSSCVEKENGLTGLVVMFPTGGYLLWLMLSCCTDMQGTCAHFWDLVPCSWWRMCMKILCAVICSWWRHLALCACIKPSHSIVERITYGRCDMSLPQSRRIADSNVVEKELVDKIMCWDWKCYSPLLDHSPIETSKNLWVWLFWCGLVWPCCMVLVCL